MEPYILKNLIEGGVGLLAGTAAGYIDSKVSRKGESKTADYIASHKFLRSAGIVLSFDAIQSLLAVDFPSTWLAEPFSDAVQGDIGGVAGIYSGLYFGNFIGDIGIKSLGKSLKQHL